MEDLSEKEQIDVIRSWWRENGNYVVSGAVLGIVLLVGWNQWQGSVTSAREQASALYETLTEHVTDGKLAAAEDAASTLYNEYQDTTYSGQAKLAMARLYMDKGRDEDAARVLRDLLDSDAGDYVRYIGKLRLAKVLLYQGKSQEVVDLLEGDTETAFTARYSEMLGDAYVLLERFDVAAEAYALALADNRQTPTIDLPLVQMKANDLPEAGEVAAIDESLVSGESKVETQGTGEISAPDEPLDSQGDAGAAQ